MNATVLCIVSALAAPPMDAVPEPDPSPFARVIRGQSPEPLYQSPPLYAQGPSFGGPVSPGIPVQSGPVISPDPFSGTVTPDAFSGTPIAPGGIPPQGIPLGPPTQSVPSYTPVLPPVQSGVPLTGDPFLSGGGLLPNYSDPPGLLPVSYSLNGLHPYRFGVTHRMDVGYLPEKSTKRAAHLNPLGSMGIFEVDFESEYTFPVFDRSIFSTTLQYGMRSWDGPNRARRSTPANPFANSLDLPGNVHRFGADFELTSPMENPVIFQVGFNPSFNTDFESNLSNDAWNYDSRLVAFHRVSPRTTLVGGLLYWDRVDDLVLPYIGVIRRPDPRREYMLVFPHPRISFLIGDAGGVAKWLYLRGEYHVESYQIDRQPIVGFTGGRFRDQIQLRDWRILAGVRTVNPYGVSAFLEAGIVFDREVEFRRTTPEFDISSGFILRGGLSF